MLNLKSIKHYKNGVIDFLKHSYKPSVKLLISAKMKILTQK